MLIQYLVIIFIFLIILLFYLLKKWQKSKLLKFLPIFYEGKVKSNYIFYSKISGLYNSIFSEVNFYPQSKNSPAKVKIIMDYRENERWRIKRKIPFDLDISFLPKIEVEDNYFKEYFIIRAKEAEFIKPILYDPRKNELIKKIFEKKESQILETKKGKLSLLLTNKTASNLQREELEEILGNLQKFIL